MLLSKFNPSRQVRPGVRFHGVHLRPAEPMPAAHDVRHSRPLDTNAIVFSLLHMHNFQIHGEAVCRAVELFEGSVSVVSGALRFVKAA